MHSAKITRALLASARDPAGIQSADVIQALVAAMRSCYARDTLFTRSAPALFEQLAREERTVLVAMLAKEELIASGYEHVGEFAVSVKDEFPQCFFVAVTGNGFSRVDLVRDSAIDAVIEFGALSVPHKIADLLITADLDTLGIFPLHGYELAKRYEVNRTAES